MRYSLSAKMAAIYKIGSFYGKLPKSHFHSFDSFFFRDEQYFIVSNFARVAFKKLNAIKEQYAYDELKRIKLKGILKMDVKIESAWFQTSIQTKIQDISMILERKRIIILEDRFKANTKIYKSVD